jgi:hypothetical protein
LALGLIAPVVISSWLALDDSPKVLGYSQELLVNVRIPHHCLPALWCDPIAVGQILWVMLGIILAGKTRLRSVLFSVFLISAILTLIQVATGSDALALLFPWRASVVLVPLATTVILSRLVLLGATWLEKTPAVVTSGVVMGGLVVAGLLLMVFRQGFQASPDEAALVEFVRDNKAPGDVYLLPVTVPNLKATTRGSLSSDWKPAADKQSDPRLVPVDLQRFRLATGAAIYVDFKAIPYKEIIDWHERLKWNQQIYEEIKAGQLDQALKELHRNHITHVVLKADQLIQHDRWVQVHEDAIYRVYRLRNE